MLGQKSDERSREYAIFSEIIKFTYSWASFLRKTTVKDLFSVPIFRTTSSMTNLWLTTYYLIIVFSHCRLCSILRYFNETIYFLIICSHTREFQHLLGRIDVLNGTTPTKLKFLIFLKVNPIHAWISNFLVLYLKISVISQFSL